MLFHLHIGADTVSERHLRDGLNDAAETYGIRRNDVSMLDGRADEVEVTLQRLAVGHVVCTRRVTYDIYIVSRSLELGADNRAGIDSRNTESHKHRRHVDVLECSAHRILASD